MFKLILLAATAAFVNAQSDKVDPPKAQTAPLERKFTDDEIKSLSLYVAQLQVIRDKDKAEDLEKQYRQYQTDIAPIAAKQKAIVKAACVAVGVPEAAVETGECGVAFGLDPAGNPINGPDGKPVESKVWHVVPKTPATPLIPAKK